MKATEGKIGRVFILRLEDGDIVPDCIEAFALENGIGHGQVVLVGGIGGGEIVVGPRESNVMPPDPIYRFVEGAHETAAVGVLAPDGYGRPVLHIHGSLGRDGKSVTGCLRPGVKTWLVAEAVVYEIKGVNALRLPDAASGFTLLNIKD